jgi:hypothetical protein
VARAQKRRQLSRPQRAKEEEARKRVSVASEVFSENRLRARVCVRVRMCRCNRMYEPSPIHAA